MSVVTIDGERYVPVTDARSVSRNIGVAITTHNRPDDLKQSLTGFNKHIPEGLLRFIVVGDNKDSVKYAQDMASLFPGLDITVAQSQPGVANAKNKCLEKLMAYDLTQRSRVEHIFLFDDDCFPKIDHWEQPYIDGPEPHYSHSFGLNEIYRADTIVATHAVGGTMLYYQREVIEQVGGLRTSFGTWGCEHVNLSDRIFNRGLTTFRYQDIPAAYDGDVFTELDRSQSGRAVNPTHKSSATQEQIDYNMTEGRKLWQSLIKTDDAYVPYRPQVNVILTCLFTQVTDPQRGRNTGLNAQSMSKLYDSQKDDDSLLVIFTDDRRVADYYQPKPGTRIVMTKPVIRTDYARWAIYRKWLLENPMVDRIFAVDATDVILCNTPWPDMQEHTLYIGSEPDTYRSNWLHKQGNDTEFLKFINQRPAQPLLNCGLVGGDYPVMLRFCNQVMHYWQDDQIDNIQCWERNLLGTDMAAANMTAIHGMEQHAWTLSYGPHVNQVFRTPIGMRNAWWAHKFE